MTPAARGLAILACLTALVAGCGESRTRPDAAGKHGPSPGTGETPRKDGEVSTQVEAPAAHALPAAPDAAPEPAATLRLPPRLSAKSAVYDSRGSAYALLQSPRSALGDFPTDVLGRIDWVAALRQGMIAPRADVSGRGTMRRRSDDIIMRNTREMPWVRFPHAQHTEWLDCSNCHPKPFATQAGANPITMDSIMRGQDCGMCHDRVAFSIFACERCHSVMHEGSPAAWW